MFGLKEMKKDLLPEGYTNEHSPNGIFKKEKEYHGCMV